MPDVAWNGKWHPFAERFPMLSEQELRDMADSIKETGQLNSCVMTPDGLGLDGRNRVAACRIAGVEPRWTVNDGNPMGIIIAQNVRHRFLDTGQRAMAVAVELVDRGMRRNGRWKRGSVPDAPDIVKSDNTWQGALHRAGVILDWLPSSADNVMSGSLALDAAYKQASEKRAADDDRSRKLSKLPDDLAALVESGVRDIDDALQEVEARKTVTEVDAIRNGDGAPEPTFAQWAENGSISWQEAATLAEEWLQERRDAIQRDRERLQRLSSAWPVLKRIADNPLNPYTTDIINGLDRSDRETVDEVIRQIRKENEYAG